MKLKRIILGCLVSFLSLNVVNAANIEINGVSSLKTNEVAKYELKLSNVGSEEFNQIEFEIEYDNNLIKFAGGTDDYGTSEKYSGNNAIIINSDKFTDGVIGSFTMTSLSQNYANTSFTIKNIVFKNSGVEVSKGIDSPKTLTLKQGTPQTTTKALNTSAKITSISFKNGTMKPAFNNNTKEYKLYTKDTIRQVTINYNSEQTGVTLKSECSLGCTVSETSDNIIQTVQGKNEVTFTFTSEDGKNTETYKFIIYRGETTDGSNKLSSLIVKDFNINETFNEDILDYTLSVPFEKENLEIDAIAADPEATVKIKGHEQLKVGENIITITVIPTDNENDINIYNITIVREEFIPEQPTRTEVAEIVEKGNNNIITIIIIIIIGLILIGLAAYFIFFYKGKKKKEDTKPNEKKEENKTNIEDTFVSNTIEEALDDLMKTKDIFDTKDTLE